MTFPNGGQRDEGHPGRKVGREIYSVSPAWKRTLARIDLEDYYEAASIYGFTPKPKPSGKGRNIVSGRKPS